ncbi:MAG: Protease HtpX-like protein [Candidatus Magasanikbacteria bacterium GW2011_GWD2_43_18]|nr:MAG: Protease HtpX-like protein [Candidatus Magasanikbacteria bacterium GW2011_GWD2_43_18]
MTWLSYFHGDKIALKSAGAKEITKEDNPYVYRMVENLTITAGMPMPRVHIIDSPAMNAFATGRDPEHASIAFTTGIINALENEELEGVAAHELSHVQNLCSCWNYCTLVRHVFPYELFWWTFI